jgi:GxxExxY protein
MPIQFGARIKVPSPSEFKGICYEAMKHAFDVHNEFGRLFDEKIYQRALEYRIKNSISEVPVFVSFEGYQKTYYLDLLIEEGVVFELKAIEHLQNRHRGQLLNYLFLTGLPSGKLINFRAERVEHEFVNNPITYDGRRIFEIVDDDWTEFASLSLKDRTIALLLDWGTGLEIGLYEEAAAYLCGQSSEDADIEIRHNSHLLGIQQMKLAAPKIAIRCTAFPPEGLIT